MATNAIALYIQQETFCEPRSAAGNNDITVPSEKVIIETKLWNGIEYYQSDFPELNEYLDKIGYSEGYYIVFDYKQRMKLLKLMVTLLILNLKGKKYMLFS